MKIQKKVSVDEIVIFDGPHSKELYGSKSIYMPDGRAVTFCVKDFEGKKLDDLLTKFETRDKEILIKESGFTNVPPSYLSSHLSSVNFQELKHHYYKNDYHMELEYFIKDDLLFIFTFGEKQPSRWILILEAIWQLEGNSFPSLYLAR